VAKSIRRVVGPQFLDLFWRVACGLWDLFFLKAAGGTRVEGYYRMQASGPAPFFSIFLIGPKILPKINPRISAQPLAAL